MKITVARLWKTEHAVTGTVSIDGVQKYFSLELPELFNGVPNVQEKTCVLPGTYFVERLWSGHFNRMMPHIVGTPGRTDVEIHVANFPQDIRGCIGIGMKRVSDTQIGESQVAFDEFDKDFERAIKDGETVTILIV